MQTSLADRQLSSHGPRDVEGKVQCLDSFRPGYHYRVHIVTSTKATAVYSCVGVTDFAESHKGGYQQPERGEERVNQLLALCLALPPASVREEQRPLKDSAC